MTGEEEEQIEEAEAMYHVVVAEVLRELGYQDRAEESYMKAVSIDPWNSQIRVRYSAFLAHTGRIGAALAELEDLYRLLAIAKYDDRYVVPPAHAEDAGRLMAQHEQLFCSLDADGGPGMGGHGIRSFRPAGAPDEVARSQTFRGDDGRVHFNLLGWNARDRAPNLFPEEGTS